jgi:hypothetical protein
MSPGQNGQTPDFSSWAPAVEAAIEFARTYPSEFRAAIVHALLLGPGAGGREPARPAPSLGEADPWQSDENGRGALARLAESLHADPNVLRRIIDIDPQGGIRILARLEGTSTAQLQNRYCAVYALVRETAFGAQDTPQEELRELCERHRCYDMPNFTRNFRAGGWLNEVTKTRRNKRYRLSREGENEARRLLLDLLGQ